MRQLILGTAGHIDHGKTALVKALTGVETDRLPEEQKRGITIDLGFADLTLDDDTHVGIVDVPGHEGFVRNMLAGATGIDLGLLVVAADEGVMPQTREHLAILQLLGVRGLVVALTKSDLADVEWRGLVVEEVRELLAPGPYADCPIIAVSARTGDGLDDLVETIRGQANRTTARRADDLFRMPIDRVFTVRGTGTVVTGTAWSGMAHREQWLRLMPAGRKVRVRAIQTHGHDRASASAGERSAIALAGVDRAEVARGDVLVDSDAWVAGHIVTVRLGVLPDAAPIRRGQRVRFHLGTVEALGRVVPLDRAWIDGGDEAWAQLRLEQTVVARAGDRFVLRSYSPITTIGGGRIAEPAAPRRKRLTSTLNRLLTDLLDGDPTASAGAAVRIASWAGMPADRLTVLAPLPPHEADGAARDPASRIRRIGGVLVHEDLVEEAMNRMTTVLREYHGAQPLAPGVSREQLRQVVPAVAPALADHAIANLAEAGVLVIEGHTARLAHHEARLTPDQDRAANEILEVLARAGVSAPSRAELPDHLSSRSDADDLIHYLQRQGRVVALAEDRYILSGAASSAIAQVRASLGGRVGLGPGDFRDLFGISRKYLIPLLGYLDRLGVTVRNGELRDVPQVETARQAERG